jgi:amino acid transporter
MMLLGVVEVLILLVLAVAALNRPGPGDVNLVSYSLPDQASLSGLCLGVVFAILSFTGFESVAPLAEETRDPRRNLPRAILGSITLMGLFYLFCSWAVLIGWGTGAMAGFVAAEENPVSLMAGRLWHAGRWVVLLAPVLTSDSRTQLLGGVPDDHEVAIIAALRCVDDRFLQNRNAVIRLL